MTCAAGKHAQLTGSTVCGEKRLWGTTAVASIEDYTAITDFGTSAAMSDNYAIVGAWGAKKAFIFARNASTDTWGTTAVATLTGCATCTDFGYSVSISDNYAIVGAYRGKQAFIYARDASSGEWSTTAAAPLTSYTTEGQFGVSVAMTDNYAIVGAHTAGTALRSSSVVTDLLGTRRRK
jgi:hypothetical protein